MKKFRLDANCEFYADDIINAFRKIADHFTCLADHMEDIRECDSQLFIGGDISIKPSD